MNKIKVLSILGTRPGAIKMAPLVKENYYDKYVNWHVDVNVVDENF